MLPDPTLLQNAPKRTHLSVWMIRFIKYHNKLDGILPFASIWWGVWTLALPDFWPMWGAYDQLMAVTMGEPRAVSVFMIMVGFAGYLSKVKGWRSIRTFVFLASLAAWGLLAVVSYNSVPVLSPGVALYSALAIMKMVSYINFQMDSARGDSIVQ